MCLCTYEYICLSSPKNASRTCDFSSHERINRATTPNLFGSRFQMEKRWSITRFHWPWCHSAETAAVGRWGIFEEFGSNSPAQFDDSFSETKNLRQLSYVQWIIYGMKLWLINLITSPRTTESFDISYFKRSYFLHRKLTTNNFRRTIFAQTFSLGHLFYLEPIATMYEYVRTNVLLLNLPPCTYSTYRSIAFTRRALVVDGGTIAAISTPLLKELELSSRPYYVRIYLSTVYLEQLALKTPTYSTKSAQTNSRNKCPSPSLPPSIPCHDFAQENNNKRTLLAATRSSSKTSFIVSLLIGGKLTGI